MLLFWLCACSFLFSQNSEIRSDLVVSEPVTCSGNDDIVIRNRVIKTSGIGILITGNCEAMIVDCYIEAGRTGVLLQGNGTVRVVNSVVKGGEASLSVQGNGDIEYSGNTLSGPLRDTGIGQLIDQGGNKSLNESVGTTFSGSKISIGNQSISVSGANIKLGTGGIVVEDEEGDQVVAGLDGTTHILSEDSSVIVDGNNIRIQEGSDETTISGDWRSTSVHVNTEQILSEMNAVSKDGTIQLQLSGDVLFDFNSNAIKAEAAAQLAKVAHLIRQKAVGQIRVFGHTDSKGNDQYNMKLSRERAASVMKWLNTHEGIPANILTGEGMGSKKPIAYNNKPDGSDDPEGRAKNRRVEIQIQETSTRH